MKCFLEFRILPFRSFRKFFVSSILNLPVKCCISRANNLCLQGTSDLFHFSKSDIALLRLPEIQPRLFHPTLTIVVLATVVVVAAIILKTFGAVDMIGFDAITVVPLNMPIVAVSSSGLSHPRLVVWRTARTCLRGSHSIQKKVGGETWKTTRKICSFMFCVCVCVCACLRESIAICLSASLLVGTRTSYLIMVTTRLTNEVTNVACPRRDRPSRCPHSSR